MKKSNRPGTLLISLDFELFWGMLDQCPLEAYEENVTSLRHVVQKGRNILIAFKDNCQYSFLIQYQKLTNGSF